jgi:hypothetical protein
MKKSKKAKFYFLGDEIFTFRGRSKRQGGFWPEKEELQKPKKIS